MFISANNSVRIDSHLCCSEHSDLFLKLLKQPTQALTGLYFKTLAIWIAFELTSSIILM